MFTLDEICGSIVTHELQMKKEELEEKIEAKEKKKNLALKISTLEEELEDLSSDDDEELAMMARRFRKFMGRKSRRFGRKNLKKDQGFF
ncbi:Uncharacterized protein TCM_013103 [Theobroma cacao]|uniref:Uncharacterized protein n=1 Tax=Theobroma cacao TaxID=3641 RepID=A0A061FVB4_THECC|nr:Uncharacterized protein TCM_013103 [Theobroma cacao]